MSAADRGPRYRAVPISLWVNVLVLALSDAGRALLFYLMTGPNTGQVPGLFTLGVAEAAEKLRRDPRTVRKALDELIAADLVEYDEEARVVWRKDAIHEQPPRTSCYIAGWSEAWRMVPACKLRDKACAHLADYCETRGREFSLEFARIAGVQPPGSPEVDGGANPSSGQQQPPRQEQRPVINAAPRAGSRGRTPVGGLPARVGELIRASAVGNDFDAPAGFARTLVAKVRETHDVTDDEIVAAVEGALAELAVREDIESPAAMLIEIVRDELGTIEDPRGAEVIDLDAHRPPAPPAATVPTAEIIAFPSVTPAAKTSTTVDPGKRAEFAARLRAQVGGVRSLEADGRERERVEEARDRLEDEIAAERARQRSAVNE